MNRQQLAPVKRGLVLAVFLIASGVASSDAVSAGGGGCHSASISEDEGVTVAVRKFCFEPTVLRVTPGETVTWTNEDEVLHTVTGVNNVWGSYDQLSLGQSVSERFEEPGVYPYWCALHPSMLGTVVVEDSAGASVAAAADDSSELGWGIVGAGAGMMLASMGMIAWRRRPSLFSQLG